MPETKFRFGGVLFAETLRVRLLPGEKSYVTIASRSSVTRAERTKEPVAFPCHVRIVTRYFSGAKYSSRGVYNTIRTVIIPREKGTREGG